MTYLTALFWILNIVFDTCGQLAFKAGANTLSKEKQTTVQWLASLKNVWVMVGIGCYVFEFFLWLAFLSLVPLSEGVLLGSINIVAVLIAGRFFFAEKLSSLHIAGILLIAAGVSIVGIYT